jgi:antitoxin (DNA-binding transcriptional repressor) of toxin-antitoxin stability system
MKHVSIKEAEGRLAELAQEAQAGERILLTLNGQPIAELAPPPATREPGGINWQALEDWKRERGVDRIVSYLPDDFDDPLPEDFLITPGR